MSTEKMDWNKLLCSNRFKGPTPAGSDPDRTSFTQDYDRILFSSPFRRLGKKTQVHPLNTNDHVHSRLTHSLEVASVGRSLGIRCGRFLHERRDLPADYLPEHIGQIVQAACLSHDIGNPPFGHAGEEAIKSWFSSTEQAELIAPLTTEEKNDFLHFEGNAQGFRILTKTEYYRDDGGMRLTYATLASMLKYPWTSTIAQTEKKFCSFQSEKEILNDIAETVGLIKLDRHKFCRHPLAHLVEAADDICYRILDLEDAHEMNILQFEDVADILAPLCNTDERFERMMKENISNRRKLAYIRAKAIGTAVDAVAAVFRTRYTEIMTGQLPNELISYCSESIKGPLDCAKRTGREKVYNEHRKVELEIGCYSILGILLNAFCSAVADKCNARGNVNYKSARVLALLCHNTPVQDRDLHESLLVATDYISGMTDNYATHLARQLGGMGE